jgi:hypothetical protein
MSLLYSHWAPADRVTDVEAHVRAHLSSIAAVDDSPTTYADAVRITRTDVDDGVLVTGELDAEPDAPYLHPGWTPEPDDPGSPTLGPPGQGAAAAVARCLAINARLRAAGITVREAAGWQTRGNGQTAVYEGGLVHHTATGFGIALPGSGAGGLLINGRADLSGPLCNYAGNEDGSITVIAAHPANHAGASGGRAMGPLPVTSLFNRRVLGLEIVYPGTSSMRPAQYRAALVWAKAVAEVCGGGDLERVRAHAETSITGKWDPGHAPGRTVDMTAFRSAADNQEADLTPEERGWLKFVHDRIAGAVPQRYYVPDPQSPAGIREVPPGTAGARPAHVLDTLDGNYLVRQLAPLADDEAKVLDAVQRLREALGNGTRSVTGDHLDQLAEAIADQLPGPQVDDFVTRLRTAAARTGKANT